MKHMTILPCKAITITIFAIFMLSFFNTLAEAIPAFARKYKTSCTTCHVAYPKLNAFGETFRRNGYQIPEVDERYVKEKPVSLGAPAWKEVWPEGVWPNEISGTAPFSLWGSSFYRYDAESRVKHDFTFPSTVVLESAGTLGEDVSFFGSIWLIRSGGDFGGLWRLFLKFNDPLSGILPDRLFNVTIGQFEPSAVPVSNNRKLTHTPFLINNFSVGKNDFRFSNQRGVEVDGLVSSRLEYAVGIVNGNGTGRLDRTTNSVDNNTTKDVYARLGYKFGGFGLDGSGLISEKEDVLPEVKAEKSLYVGAIGYSGKNKFTVSNRTYDDNFYRYGFTFDFNYESLNLFGAVVQGSHANAYGNFKDTSVIAYFSEADLAIYPWLIAAVRYGVVDIERETENKDEVIVSLSALIRANIKLVVEGALHTTGGEGDLGIVKLEFTL